MTSQRRISPRMRRAAPARCIWRGGRRRQEAEQSSRKAHRDAAPEGFEHLSILNSAVVARLVRAIQYAAAYPLNHEPLWNTGSPAFAGDDSGECDEHFQTQVGRVGKAKRAHHRGL